MYTPKLDELIQLVNNFSKNHIASTTNGIRFSTAPFKEHLFASNLKEFHRIYGNKSENIYQEYLEISEKSYYFNEFLKEYVQSDSFLDKWNK